MSKHQVSALACYAFETVVAVLENKTPHSLSAYQRALGEEVKSPGSHPLFVTWNKYDKDYDEYILRGCIGTFSTLGLDRGVPTYSKTAAFEDTRFRPIAKSEFPSLECGVTVLRQFEACDPHDWEVGVHGVKAEFSDSSSATFLPDVAVEQGWDQDQTLVHLASKAGVRARSLEKILASIVHFERYQGDKSAVRYDEFMNIRQGLDQKKHREK